VSPAAVDVVLSGGGAKTAAHLGAVRALLETGHSPARYIATSMGAVIAAALASGHTPAAVLDRLAEVGPRGIAREPLAVVSGLFTRGLLRSAPFRGAVELIVPVRRFADLALPLTVAVADLDTGALLVFGAGGEDAPLVDVLCASCALPLYFAPVMLGGRRCGDGGLRGVMPLEAAARVVSRPTIAIDVGPGFDTPPGAPPAMPPVVRAHDETVGTLMASHTLAQLALWRAEAARPPLTYIRPRVERNATFQVDRMRRYADDGYQAARAVLAAPAHT
jgi:predicted acylesterase/phospholipase RssA